MTNDTEVKQTVSARVAAPFHKAELAKFLDAVPDDADISVVTFMGGDQRDPYPTGFAFSASWSV